MATYRFFVYDILDQLKKQGEERDLTPMHVVWWTMICANRLRYARSMETESGKYVTRYEANVKVDSTFGDVRQYIELPAEVYDLPNEGGIEYIAYWLDGLGQCSCVPTFTLQNFSFVSPGAARRLYMNEHETPSSDNPYAYRIDSRIYLLGTECLDLGKLELALRAELNPKSICSLDEEIDVAPDQLEELRWRVMKIAASGFGLPMDLQNDGASQQGGRVPVPSPEQDPSESE